MAEPFAETISPMFEKHYSRLDGTIWACEAIPFLQQRATRHGQLSLIRLLRRHLTSIIFATVYITSQVNSKSASLREMQETISQRNKYDRYKYNQADK